MDAKEYIVVICGCEGIERIWEMYHNKIKQWFISRKKRKRLVK